MNERVNDGTIFDDVTRNAENTTETPFEAFVPIFAAVYNS